MVNGTECLVSKMREYDKGGILRALADTTLKVKEYFLETALIAFAFLLITIFNFSIVKRLQALSQKRRWRRRIVGKVEEGEEEDEKREDSIASEESLQSDPVHLNPDNITS